MKINSVKYYKIRLQHVLFSQHVFSYRYIIITQWNCISICYFSHSAPCGWNSQHDQLITIENRLSNKWKKWMRKFWSPWYQVPPPVHWKILVLLAMCLSNLYIFQNMADDRVREVKINLKRLRYFVKHNLYFFLNERWNIIRR
jgi:hypothetical protein